MSPLNVPLMSFLCDSINSVPDCELPGDPLANNILESTQRYEMLIYIFYKSV